MPEFSQTKGAEILAFDASHKSFMMDLGPTVLEHLAIKAKVNHDFSEGCQIKLVDSRSGITKKIDIFSYLLRSGETELVNFIDIAD